MSSKVCVVTGASGFVGSHLCRRLLLDGHTVRALSRSKTSIDTLSSSYNNSHLEFIIIDITDSSALSAACSGADVVFHLAALISYSKQDLNNMIEVNVNGTRNVVAACASSKARLVHCSTVCAIGASDTEPKQLLTETTPYNLGHLNIGYCETKREAESIVFSACELKTIDGVIVNPSNVYGSGDAVKSSRKAQIKAALGKMIFYSSGGVNVVHIDDVIQGFVAAWKRGRSGQRYIIGGENITVHEMLSLFSRENNASPPFIRAPILLQKTLATLLGLPVEKIMQGNMYNWYSSAKARNELGYIGARTAQQAIHDSVDFMQCNLPQFKRSCGGQTSGGTLKMGFIVACLAISTAVFHMMLE